jgi:hypothetical protein
VIIRAGKFIGKQRGMRNYHQNYLSASTDRLLCRTALPIRNKFGTTTTPLRTTDDRLLGRRPPKRQGRASYQPGPSAQDHHRR